MGSVVVVLGGLAALGGIFALQALQVRDDLLVAKATLSSVTELAKTGDTAQIQAAADDVLALTTRADAVVGGPLWALASEIPGVGVNVDAVRSATEATHILARDAMPPAMQLLDTVQLDQLKVEGGGVNLDPLRGAIDVLPEIDAAFTDARAHVAHIDREELMPVVGDAIGQLLGVIDQAGPALQAARQHLPTLLQLAGSEGPRTYIVLFQNNAEIRATGGNAATSAIVEVDNGKITMREDDETTAFHLAGMEGDGTYPLPDETLSLYEEDFVPFSQNYTRTPDFPTSAQMYRSLWQETNGGEIDGVISVDPVALSYMLRATGPVTLDDGSQLTSDNVVKAVLSDVYERFGTDNVAADAFFAEVAGRVFETVSSGSWEPLAMLDQLTLGAQEERVYLWFPREAEQALSVQFDVDGALTKDNVAKTQVGLYVNNASYSKLEYYLSTSIEVTCDTAARTTTTTLTATSAVPGDDLSGYTLGWRNPSLDLPRTTMLLDTVYFAPPGATITAVQPADGDLPLWHRTGIEEGHAAESITLALPMGETRTAAFTSTIPEGALGPLSVRSSPTVGQTPITVAGSCDGLFG